MMLATPRAKIAARAARFSSYAVLAGSLVGGCHDKGGPSPSEDGGAELPFYRLPREKDAAVPDSDAPAPPAVSPDASPPAVRSPPPQKSGLGCQGGMIGAGSYCIDAYEIHLVEGTGPQHPYYMRPPEGMRGLRAVSSGGVFPQGYLDQTQARLACQNAGKRLCTLDEWQMACRGAGGMKYPYGMSFEGGRYNTLKAPHILDKIFPDIPHLRRMGREFNDPRLLQEPGYLARTGEYAGCATESGIHDLAGNLSEWVDDSVMRGGMLYGTFAGGPFSGPVRGGCGHWTNVHAAKYSDYSIGTRCCADRK